MHVGGLVCKRAIFLYNLALLQLLCKSAATLEVTLKIQKACQDAEDLTLNTCSFYVSLLTIGGGKSQEHFFSAVTVTRGDCENHCPQLHKEASQTRGVFSPQ